MRALMVWYTAGAQTCLHIMSINCRCGISYVSCGLSDWKLETDPAISRWFTPSTRPLEETLPMP